MVSRPSRLVSCSVCAVGLVALVVGATVLGVLLRLRSRGDTLRINCGGPSLSNGVLADNRTYWGHTEVDVLTQSLGNVNKSVYKSNAFAPGGNDLVYTFTVKKNSNVQVKVRWAELFEGAKKRGVRNMTLLINGEVIKADIDIWKLVGKLATPWDWFHEFTTTNGTVEVRIKAFRQNAIVSGIDVTAPGGVLAGGPLAILPGNNSTNQTIVGADASNISPPIINNNTNLTADNSTARNNNSTSTTTDTSTNTTTSTTPSTDADTTTTEPVSPPTVPSGPTLGAGAKFYTATVKSGSPVKRHEACAVMAGGKVYLLGGRGKKPVDVYDPVAQVWTTKKMAPVEMNHFQCVAIGELIYAVGSWFGSFPREEAHPDTYVYNTVSDSWSTIAGIPTARNRGGGATVVYGTRICTASGNQGGHGVGSKSVDMFDCLDTADIAAGWKAMPPIPEPRDHVGGALVGDTFCVLGGRNGGVANFWGTPITSVNCFDFKSNTWAVKKAVFPSGRAGAATGTTCDGLIMVAGGEGRAPGATSGGSAFSRVDLYDLAQDKFTAKFDMVAGRHGSGLAIADCKCGNIYIPSGSGGLGGGPELTSTEVWSPDGVVRAC